jgi:hypothetical protein
MTFYNTFVRHQNFGILASILGVLGLAFFGWAPAGMILAVAGLLFGLIGLMRVRFEAAGYSWVVVGLVLCAAALALDVWVAANGFTLVQLRSYQ